LPLPPRQTHVSHGKLRVTKEPKTDRGRRTIPVDPRAVVALRAHRRSQAAERLAAGEAYGDQNLVFADEIGEPLRPDTVSAAFKRHVRGAELPHLTLPSPTGCAIRSPRWAWRPALTCSTWPSSWATPPPYHPVDLPAHTARPACDCRPSASVRPSRVTVDSVGRQWAHGRCHGPCRSIGGLCVSVARWVSEGGLEPPRAAKLTRPST
jgi:hypothetical protein